MVCKNFLTTVHDHPFDQTENMIDYLQYVTLCTIQVLPETELINRESPQLTQHITPLHVTKNPP